jgi:NADPH:quinone reductase-like Zn-dependent oxidoreductase
MPTKEKSKKNSISQENPTELQKIKELMKEKVSKLLEPLAERTDSSTNFGKFLRAFPLSNQSQQNSEEEFNKRLGDAVNRAKEELKLKNKKENYKLLEELFQRVEKIVFSTPIQSIFNEIKNAVVTITIGNGRDAVEIKIFNVNSSFMVTVWYRGIRFFETKYFFEGTNERSISFNPEVENATIQKVIEIIKKGKIKVEIEKENRFDFEK